MAKFKPSEAQKVRQRVKAWNDANKSNHVQYYYFLDFVFGSQWQDDEVKVFSNYRKIALTANKISPMSNHLLGEQRQNTPQLEIQPDDDIPVDVADIRAALIKRIAFDSPSKIANQKAYQCAVVGGFGAKYWLPEYTSNDSFDMEPRVYDIPDPCKAYWDLSAKKESKTDGQCAGFRTKLSRDNFARLFGRKLEQKIGQTALDLEDDANMVNMSFADEQSITIIDDFYRETTKVKLVELSNGELLKGDELQKLTKDTDENGEDTGLWNYEGDIVRIENSRMINDDTIIHTQWAGDYELAREIFPTKENLPVVFVDQNSYLDKHGKQIFRPFFKDAVDTQKYINYLRTHIAYLVKTSRADQFIAARANMAAPDTQKIWRDPAIVQGALVYDESPHGNKPERLAPFEIPQTLMAQYQEAAADLQQVTGIYDTQMGNQGDVVSGRASDAQTKRGGVNTFITRDALDRSICTDGEIVNEMIPFLYNRERKVNLELKDRGMKTVHLNKPKDDYGSGVENDMTDGKYSIRLIPGQSYEGQKSQNLESLEILLQADPGLFNSIADLVVENLPMQNHLELRNRLRALVPPEILQAGKTGEPPPPKPQQPPPELMIKMQELQQKQQMAQLDFQHKMAALQQKQQEMQLDAHKAGADTTLEMQKIAQQRTEAEAKLRESEQRYSAEMERIRLDANSTHAGHILQLLTHNSPKEFNDERKQRTAAEQRDANTGIQASQ